MNTLRKYKHHMIFSTQHGQPSKDHDCCKKKTWIIAAVTYFQLDPKITLTRLATPAYLSSMMSSLSCLIVVLWLGVAIAWHSEAAASASSYLDGRKRTRGSILDSKRQCFQGGSHIDVLVIFSAILELMNSPQEPKTLLKGEEKELRDFTLKKGSNARKHRPLQL